MKITLDAHTTIPNTERIGKNNFTPENLAKYPIAEPKPKRDLLRDFSKDIIYKELTTEHLKRQLA